MRISLNCSISSDSWKNIESLHPEINESCSKVVQHVIDYYVDTHSKPKKAKSVPKTNSEYLKSTILTYIYENGSASGFTAKHGADPKMTHDILAELIKAGSIISKIGEDGMPGYYPSLSIDECMPLLVDYLQENGTSSGFCAAHSNIPRMLVLQAADKLKIEGVIIAEKDASGKATGRYILNNTGDDPDVSTK